MKHKYKKGDVLITHLGTFFMITGVRTKMKYRMGFNNRVGYGMYLLKGHINQDKLSIDYIDNAPYLKLASPTQQVLYGM